VHVPGDTTHGLRPGDRLGARLDGTRLDLTAEEVQQVGGGSRASTEARLLLRSASIVRTRSFAALPFCCASFALFSICVIPADVCSVADACSWEARLICSTAAIT